MSPPFWQENHVGLRFFAIQRQKGAKKKKILCFGALLVYSFFITIKTLWLCGLVVYPFSNLRSSRPQLPAGAF
jgi:hypothetical protein